MSSSAWLPPPGPPLLGLPLHPGHLLPPRPHHCRGHGGGRRGLCLRQWHGTTFLVLLFSLTPHLFAVVGEGTTGGEQQNQLGVHHVLQYLLTTLRTLDRWGVSSNNRTQTEQNKKRECFV